MGPNVANPAGGQRRRGSGQAQAAGRTDPRPRATRRPTRRGSSPMHSARACDLCHAPREHALEGRPLSLMVSAVLHCAATACLADRGTTSYRLAPRHSAQPFQQSVRPVRYISYSPTTYATICLSVPRLLFAIRIRKRSNRRDRFDPKTASRARAYHCVPDLRPPRWRSIPVK